MAAKSCLPAARHAASCRYLPSQPRPITASESNQAQDALHQPKAVIGAMIIVRFGVFLLAELTFQRGWQGLALMRLEIQKIEDFIPDETES